VEVCFTTGCLLHQKVRTALCKIYGLGKTLSSQICDQLGFSEKLKIEGKEKKNSSLLFASPVAHQVAAVQSAGSS